MSIPLLIFWIFPILILASSIRIVKEYQRAAIFRLGQFYAVRGPGPILLIPIVDKVEMIDLNKWVPDWQGLSKADLEKKVKSVALTNPGSSRR